MLGTIVVAQTVEAIAATMDRAKAALRVAVAFLLGGVELVIKDANFEHKKMVAVYSGNRFCLHCSGNSP